MLHIHVTTFILLVTASSTLSFICQPTSPRKSTVSTYHYSYNMASEGDKMDVDSESTQQVETCKESAEEETAASMEVDQEPTADAKQSSPSEEDSKPAVEDPASPSAAGEEKMSEGEEDKPEPVEEQKPEVAAPAEVKPEEQQVEADSDTPKESQTEEPKEAPKEEDSSSVATEAPKDEASSSKDSEAPKETPKEEASSSKDAEATDEAGSSSKDAEEHQDPAGEGSADDAGKDQPQAESPEAAAEAEADKDEKKPEEEKPTSEQKAFEISDEVYEFPDTLEGFGYHFNDHGQLRSVEKDEPFVFQVRKSINYNQQHYEALGEIITQYIYKLMEEELKMERVVIPIDASPDEPRTFFYMSPGAWEQDRLLVIIHGNGVVRAGQWTRKLIMNEDVDTGSQLPYIRWGIQHDYGVIVLNTNDNTAPGAKTGEAPRRIRGSDSAEAHTEYVWDRFLEPSKARFMAFVAHSYGGVCVTHLANKKDRLFRRRVFGLAFTDSVHSLELQQTSKHVKRHFMVTGRNWVSSDEPLDAELPAYLTLEGNQRIDATRVSAGTKQHERTSHTARESVFTFLQQRYDDNKSKPYSDDKITCVNM